jgi:hypothetical protein
MSSSSKAMKFIEGVSGSDERELLEYNFDEMFNYMYEMEATVESLMRELNYCIDEVNTMRDIHHRDPMTPADHWDKQSLHEAQVLLKVE